MGCGASSVSPTEDAQRTSSRGSSSDYEKPGPSGSSMEFSPDRQVNREMSSLRIARNRRNAERRSSVHVSQDYHAPIYPKDEATTAALLSALQSNRLLRNHEESQLLLMVGAMQPAAVGTGEVIMRQGEQGDELYAVIRGRFEIIVGDRVVDVWGEGTNHRTIGERALLHDAPRAATVRAVSPAEVWALDRNTFRAILVSTSIARRYKFKTCLRQAFGSLSNNELERLAAAAEPWSFRAGERIMRKNDDGEVFYVVESGQVHVTAYDQNGVPDPVGTMDLGPGGYFGERALISREKRWMDVHAIADTVLVALHRDDVMAVIGRLLFAPPAPEEMVEQMHHHPSNARLTSHPSGEHVVALLRRSTSIGSARDVREFYGPGERRPRLGIPLEDLQRGRTLGIGSYGRVRLVHHLPSGQTFALKALSKAHIVEGGQKKNVLAEADILFRVDHPFIIKLFDTYKDDNQLYMLLEYVPGGELFTRLQRAGPPGGLSLEAVRFYAACVIDALDHLHGRNILYRDLKPENLLIDSDGYIKVVDFGFAKSLPNAYTRTRTALGTAEYQSPEIRLEKPYAADVDYWAFGILLFEMVAGYSPFRDHAAAAARQEPDHVIIHNNILSGEYSFPSWAEDADLRDLVARLLVRAPRRLGARGGAAEIKAHPFFAEIDWAALRDKALPAPWVPDLPKPDPTHSQAGDGARYFEHYEENEYCPPYEDDGTGWDDDF